MYIKKTDPYVSYEQAKAFVKSVNIKSKVEYIEKCKEFRTQGIIHLPSKPAIAYSDKWVSWPNYLSKNKGAMSVAARRGASFISYDEAKKCLFKYAQEHNIKFERAVDFKKFAKTEEFINNFSMSIPIAANLYYKSKGTWKGWEDFLSVHTFGTLTYSEMHELFVKNKIDSMDALIEFSFAHPEYKISEDIEGSCTVRGDWDGWDNLFYKESEENKVQEDSTLLNNVLTKLNEVMDALKKLGLKK